MLAQRLNAGLRRVPVWPLYLLGLAPVVWLLAQGLTGGLGPDPVKALEHRLGKTALQLLVAVLAITPLMRLTRLSLIRFRRALGVLAFCYIALHLLVWLALDIQFMWPEIWTDLTERPYIMLGMAGFLMLAPLAATSNDSALRRLGAQAWRRLHRLTYPAALAGGLHYFLSVKAWPVEPLFYLGLIVLLLALRVVPLPRSRPGRARG
ncbi:protein-methionine-sulfoxide reductase heme-binding subunit MsrQ [Alkalilacustris brevis]|uniref:protein-methionine-sulfoxide reductase heme-binding subunit MsrQ n=1 Tax=Alkalilacustris brevis TaxID=2026338 RepID=UPI000E0CCFA4|nr:protein-methionine-sulfoxide reductase heme-binding subunit MsrQ [Alkalilacustris brevis]